MEREETCQEGYGGRDTQTAEEFNTLILEYIFFEPPDRKALEASSPKGDPVTVERGAPLPGEDVAVTEGSQAMAGPSYSPSIQRDNLSPQATSPPLVGGERRPPSLRGEVEDTEMDIRELLRALPTRADIQQLITAVEQACQQAVEDLREDTRALGHRVESMEKSQEVMVQVVADVQDSVKDHEDALNSYKDQLDDYENRDRRQNIRIRGLPETIQTSELTSVVQKVFSQIMGDSVPECIEIDRVHRVPAYITQNLEKPRDVICRVHTVNMQ